MRIVELRSENFKKLKLVDITPEEDVIILSGKNAVGKTSIIDSIWATLQGSAVPSTPIRNGEEKAETKVILGEGEQIKYIVKRNYTAVGNVLTVSSPEGAKFPSPQRLLDSFIGDLTFDPLAFIRLKEKDQRDLLLKIVKFNIDQTKVVSIAGRSIKDIDDLDTIRKVAFEERSQVNREVVSAEKQMNAMPVVTSTEKVSVKDLVDKKSKIEEDVRYQDKIVIDLKTAEKLYYETRDKITELENQLIHLKNVEHTVEQNILKFRDQIQHFTNYAPQLAEIDKQLQDADTVNERANQYQKRKELTQAYNEKKYSADILTRKIEQIDQLKADIIASSQMPITGLGFDGEIVTFNGLPLVQASDAQKLTISLAIAMSLNPTLRIIRINEGSELDSSSMAIVKKMAKEHDYQIWIAKVDESGQVGIYIEEGEVKTINK